MEDLEQTPFNVKDRFEYSGLQAKPKQQEPISKASNEKAFGLVDAQSILQKYIQQQQKPAYTPDPDVVIGDPKALQDLAKKYLPNWDRISNYKKDALLGMLNAEGEAFFLGDQEMTEALKKGDDNMFLYRLMQGDTADRVRFGLYYLYNDKKLLNEII